MPNVKMGADISSFKSGISAAKNEVKTLDQQMKMLDATMKAEGRSEQTLNQQTQTLNSRLAAQKNIAKQAEAALKAMTQAGVDPASDSYQKMAREMLAAQTGMMETQAALNELGNGAVNAAGGVSQLESGLNGISKKISLEQVRDVVGKISDGLENAAKKAVNLGKAIWENITDVARFSDDTATQAMILNMNVEDYQAYKKVFDTVGEITVQEWQKAKQKVQAAINKPTDEQTNILQLLGINTKFLVGDEGVGEMATKNFEEVFWEIGDRLRKKVESGELTQDLAQPVAAYSHGMKQKLAIISAWLHAPRLILMDEPFVGLDPKAAHLLKEMMREVCDEGGAIFFSTHVLEVAEKLCDKVAIIKQGQLIRSGTMEEVKGDDSLEEVFLELEGEEDIC